MNLDRPLYIKRRSRRVDHRPAIVWLVMTVALVGVVGVALFAMRAVSGDWFELKMDSARYRILEMMPQPDRPDFVPTPNLELVTQATGPIAWSAPDTARRDAATPQAAAAAQANAAEAPTLAPTSVAVVAPVQAPPTPVPIAAVQPDVQLHGVIHEAQRFNNCGPTTLRMYLSYYGYTKNTQVEIANVLKPNKEDKNVSPDELVSYAESKGLYALARVNGNLNQLKQYLSNGIPVMIEEGYDPARAHKGWMGHYLLLTGYDEKGITAQDSYNGPNQKVAWADVDKMWRHFNRTYILVYPAAQAATVSAILGADADDVTMYANAAERAEDEWRADPQDAYAAFNLGSSLVGLREYAAAAEAFDRARLLKLPWRMLWYQFGPYEAYYQAGRYQELVELADATQEGVGDLEEAYYYKALALTQLGRKGEAREMLLLALKSNPNYYAAQKALQELD